MGEMETTPVPRQAARKNKTIGDDLAIIINRGKSYAIIISMLRRNEPVYQQIVKIASSFSIFDCIPCSRAIKQFLVERGISRKQK
jgi:hypothetical protein